MAKVPRKFKLRPEGWDWLRDEERFEQLWKNHPSRCRRKNGKASAREVYFRIDRTLLAESGRPLDIELLLAAQNRQKRTWEWRKDDGQYVPDLAAWLNQQRWEDEVE